MTHELKFTKHEHVGQAVHTVWAECSCGGKTFKSTGESSSRARSVIQHQFYAHVRGAKESEAPDG
jgi:hypothetical protein